MNEVSQLKNLNSTCSIMRQSFTIAMPGVKHVVRGGTLLC